MLDQPTIALDNYELTMAAITPADIPRLYELSIAVNWPHRPADWELLVALGEGVLAQDEIGRVVGSALWFPVGERLASIGMVITSPRLQEHGAGRWLMQHIMARTHNRGKVLNATKAAYRLYLSLGFEPQKTVFQHNGVVTALPDGPDYATPLRLEQHADVVLLDAMAYGANRQPVFDHLLAVSQGTVVERAGRIAGFALCRKFGRGHVLGPVVAETEQDVLALIRPHIAAHLGQFLRLDTRAPEGPLRRFLVDAGIRLHDTVTTMSLGRVAVPEAVTTFGLVNQALG